MKLALYRYALRSDLGGATWAAHTYYLSIGTEGSPARRCMLATTMCKACLNTKSAPGARQDPTAEERRVRRGAKVKLRAPSGVPLDHMEAAREHRLAEATTPGEEFKKDPLSERPFNTRGALLPCSTASSAFTMAKQKRWTPRLNWPNCFAIMATLSARAGVPFPATSRASRSRRSRTKGRSGATSRLAAEDRGSR